MQLYTVSCMSGGVPGQNHFRTHQQAADVLAGFLELLALELLTHIGLDHADGGDVLLHALVQVIVLAESLAKNTWWHGS